MRAAVVTRHLGWVFVLALLPGCQPHPPTTPEQYQVYCARCHGPRGEGDPKTLKQNPGADLRSSPLMERGDRAALRRRISEGYGPMPAYSHRLTPAEIERMIDFILQLHPRERERP